MATCSFIKERKQTAGSMGRVIQYVSQPKKTMDEEGNRYLTGVNCVADVAMQSFMATKHLYGKDTGTFFYQYTQSFSPEEDLTPAQAHQIGLELAEQFFPGCEVLVATHVDRQHLHSHLVVNSVHPDTGKKLHFTPRTLEEMRKVSDQICMEHGLITLKPYQQDHRTKGLRAGEYRAAMRGESWKFQLITTVEAAMRRAGSREEFIQEMNRRGYQVRWEENRKCITYTTPTGMKCRDDRLHELKFRKENMEHEFGIRTQAAQQCFGSPQATGGPSHPDGTTAQCAVYDAGADGGTAGECPPAYPGSPENDPSVYGHSGHEGEPGAAGHLRLEQTQALNQETYRAMEEILSEMKEEHKRDGRQRDEFTRKLSAIGSTFQKDTQEAISSLRRWVPFIIMSSAAAAVPVCILMWQTLT